MILKAGKMRKVFNINIACLLLFILITGCDDTEIYITNQNSYINDLALCDSSVLKMYVYQDGSLKLDFTTMVIGDKICFKIINSENIDFEREISLRLEVFKENRNPLCRFRKNIIYKTSNVKLKKINAVMKIYEIDINSFYPIN